MEPKRTKPKKGPEAIIQDEIIKMLTLRGWYVKVTHGNMYQSGFPDLYATHRTYGARWIEVKQPVKYSFTDAQIRDYPLLLANGTRIWVLCAATDEEYSKLFKQQNLWVYMIAKM